MGISIFAQNKITSYQYWFDNDYSTRETVNVTPEELVNLTALLPLENLNPGLHVISIRFKDSTGLWSVSVNHYFYSAKTILQDNFIVGYRYWLDADIGNARYISLDDPRQLLDLNEEIDFSETASGEYVIHFQFKDITGKWSLVTSDSFTYINTGGIEETNQNSIRVYPNPTSGRIRIMADYEIPPVCTFEICDYMGRIVMQSQVMDVRSLEVDMSQLSKGFYYIRIKHGNSYIYKKVLLQ